MQGSIQAKIYGTSPAGDLPEKKESARWELSNK